MRIGQKCAGCHRVMRPAGTLLAEWPGTIAHHSRGMCYPCRRAQKQGRALGPSKASRPECCGRCGRRMRQRNTRLVDAPGTVQHGARDAALALVVRDLISKEHYDLLTGPWAQAIGPAHPDDPTREDTP